MSVERLSPDEILFEYAHADLDDLYVHKLRASIEAAERDDSAIIKLPSNGLMDLVARCMGAKIIPITEISTNQLPEQPSS